MPDNIRRRTDMIDRLAEFTTHEPTGSELIRTMRLNLLEYEQKARNIDQLLDGRVRLDDELGVIGSFFTAVRYVLCDSQKSVRRYRLLLYAGDLCKRILERFCSQLDAQKNMGYTPPNIQNVRDCILQGESIISQIEAYKKNKV